MCFFCLTRFARTTRLPADGRFCGVDAVGVMAQKRIDRQPILATYGKLAQKSIDRQILGTGLP